MISAVVSAGIWMRAIVHTEKAITGISARVFENHEGWGYDILVNDTIFIHQPSVPGRPGHKGFPRKEMAEEMAKRIINKMEKGKLPSVTTFEVEQIYPADERQYDESTQ